MRGFLNSLIMILLSDFQNFAENWYTGVFEVAFHDLAISDFENSKWSQTFEMTVKSPNKDFAENRYTERRIY